jgi:hypothetical protein
VDAQRAAEIQVVLEGIPLPASRDALVRYARPEDAAAAVALEQLPDREYDRLDAVGEELMRPPEAPRAPDRPPRAESGGPPGAESYVEASPVSGAVRSSAPPTNPPQQTIEQQTELQQEQQQRQES